MVRGRAARKEAGQWQQVIVMATSRGIGWPVARDCANCRLVAQLVCRRLCHGARQAGGSGAVGERDRRLLSYANQHSVCEAFLGRRGHHCARVARQ